LGSLNAQDLYKFNQVLSSGEIPSVFNESATFTYKNDRKKNKDKSLNKDFFLETRFFMNDLLLSGNVLFGDELTTYVNEVAKNILKSDVGLYEKLQFYVLKSTSVNAFSTDQGIVFVTTGLLSKLNTEAELAFILSHEVAHYTKKHVRKGFVHNHNYSKTDESKIRMQSVYSRSNEFEADKCGIDLMLKSKYDISQINSVFDVLAGSHLPFDDIPLDKEFFNSTFLKLPISMFSDSINEIVLDYDAADSLSSHPNLSSRIIESEKYIGDKFSKGNSNFLISEARFIKIKNLACFENINLKLTQKKYPEAIYDIYVLQKQYPNNYFLKFTLLKGLYGVLKYKAIKNYRNISPKLDQVEGNSYVLHDFLRNISLEELTVLVLRKATDLRNEYHTVHIQKYLDDVTKEFGSLYKSKLSEFSSTEYSTKQALVNKPTFNIVDSIAVVQNSEISPFKKRNLIAKLEKLNVKYSVKGNYREVYHYYAIPDLITNTSFLNTVNNSDLNKSRTNGGKPISHGIVFNPTYYKKIHRKNKKIKEEEQEMKFNLTYKRAIRGLHYNLLDVKGLDNVDSYNNISLLNNYLFEFYGDRSIKMINSSNSRLEILKSEFNTNHLILSNVVVEQKKVSDMQGLSILFVITAPIGLTDLALSKRHIWIENTVIDLNNDVFIRVNERTSKVWSAKRKDDYIKVLLDKSITNLQKGKGL